MKIYLVETSFGTYEDRYSKIVKAYFSKESAEKWVEEYNAKITADEAFLEKCVACEFKQVETRPNRETTSLPECYKWALYKEWEEDWFCSEWEERAAEQWDEKHLATIIEIESED